MIVIYIYKCGLIPQKAQPAPPCATNASPHHATMSQPAPSAAMGLVGTVDAAVPVALPLAVRGRRQRRRTPSRAGESPTVLQTELTDLGRDAEMALRASGVLKAEGACNHLTLGVAARLSRATQRRRGDISARLREAGLDPAQNHKSVRHWLAALEKLPLEEAVAARPLRTADRWQVGGEPGPMRHAAHWRPPVLGRRARASRAMDSPSVAVAALEQAVADGATVRCDGAGLATTELLAEWNYVSVHITNFDSALSIVSNILRTWSHPTWVRMSPAQRELEALLAVFLTLHTPSQCALHADAVDSVWLIAAGERDLFVLPPWAADAALPDVDVHSGKYDDTFSDYDPWQDSRRHSAWRCVHLQVGDWVFMPRGWWHVVRATVGSVMVNVRV
jgi:hypothetical protein